MYNLVVNNKKKSNVILILTRSQIKTMSTTNGLKIVKIKQFLDYGRFIMYANFKRKNYPSESHLEMFFPNSGFYFR